MSPLVVMADRPNPPNRPERSNGAAAQRKANRKLALILASVALVFFLGFMTKMVLLGR